MQRTGLTLPGGLQSRQTELAVLALATVFCLVRATVASAKTAKKRTSTMTLQSSCLTLQGTAKSKRKHWQARIRVFTR